MDYQMGLGDTGINLVATLKSDVSGTQTAVDFSTYASVVLFMWPEASATMTVDGVAGTFSDAANGQVSYDWGSGAPSVGGNYRAKFVCVNASAEEITFPRAEPGYFTVKVWAEAEITT